ncbi:uncharacterized protein BDFB_000513, partial [Asbolus verrucosus]
MVPSPRVLLLRCLVLIYRFYKTASPTRNWIMNSNRHPRGLPPQYPYTRRGSNTPVSSLAMTSMPPTPNRSRSLDGLLDSEPTSAASNATITEQTPSQTTKSCDDLDKDFNNKQTDDVVKLNNVKSQRMDNSLDNIDKVSIQSGSSDSKRKRNFMDRCVSK